jgi:trimethylamine:corrinoid methyltransferase-like protein
VRYLRAGEILLTQLAVRHHWDEWEKAGRKGMAERAQDKAERLLAEHEVPPLTADQERELDELMRECQQLLVPD